MSSRCSTSPSCQAAVPHSVEPLLPCRAAEIRTSPLSSHRNPMPNSAVQSPTPLMIRYGRLWSCYGMRHSHRRSTIYAIYP
ncbi:hypothetical protein Y032_0014g2339 [Ancylostoma ceylanicum]|uniref:Uncharacterized protein n=1 Tax=Ancylostoma ceylanicum TaxID=53326 RepID=A0A016VBN3_9BILA|nr:hypothetical protein Y032_0014g2339 [Ancylostoma ceylanicum]